MEEEAEEQQLRSGKYTWRIDSFSEKEIEHDFSSEAFTIGGCKWQIVIYPNREADCLDIYLKVADAATLPDGWCRDADFILTLVDQRCGRRPPKKKARVKFTARSSIWGFKEYKHLHDCAKGYVVDDTVVIEVAITLHEVVPSVELAIKASSFDSYFSSFSEYFSVAGTPHLGEESTSQSESTDLASDTLSSDDIEKAKHCLKECLSDLFKIDMRDRLSSALSILSHAGAGLSPDQQRSIETFKANFDDFLCDFLTFEQDNSDFELQKITMDHIYCTMKKNRESHLSYKQSFNGLTKEKEELHKRLKEVSSRERKLICDWETLVKESEEVKLKCTIQEKKLAEAEEKKKIAEERMSQSTSAWSSLKEQFL